MSTIAHTPAGPAFLPSGDVTPATRPGRLLALLFVPLAVVFVSNQLSVVGELFYGNATDKELDKLSKLDLTLEAILAMDEDGSGDVTEFEFLRFMLVETGMCDASALDALHTRFTALDADGSGALDADDLRQEPLGLGPSRQGEGGIKVHKDDAKTANDWSQKLMSKLSSSARSKVVTINKQIVDNEDFSIEQTLLLKQGKKKATNNEAKAKKMEEQKQSSTRATRRVSAVGSAHTKELQPLPRESKPIMLRGGGGNSADVKKTPKAGRTRNPVNTSVPSPPSSRNSSREKLTAAPRRSSKKFEPADML